MKRGVKNPIDIIMMGDLVYNHRDWVCPVVGMDEDTVTVIAQHYGKSTYRKEEIRPIPLTEDIILSLGWEEIGEGHPDYMNKISLGKQFKHPWYTYPLTIIENSLVSTYWTLRGEFILRYVHDLQHVLHHTVEDEIRYDYEKNEWYLYDAKYEYRYKKKEGV